MHSVQKSGCDLLLTLEAKCFRHFGYKAEDSVAVLSHMGLEAAVEPLPEQYSMYNTLGDDIFPCIRVQNAHPGWDLWVCEESFMVNRETGEIFDEIGI